jgi:hypothetical protein
MEENKPTIEEQLLVIKKEMDLKAIQIFRLHQRSEKKSIQFIKKMIYIEEHFRAYGQLPSSDVAELMDIMTDDLDADIQRQKKGVRFKEVNAATGVQVASVSMEAASVPSSSPSFSGSLVENTSENKEDKVRYNYGATVETYQLLTRQETAGLLKVDANRIRHMFDPKHDDYDPWFPKPTYIGKMARFHLIDLIAYTRRKQFTD